MEFRRTLLVLFVAALTTALLPFGAKDGKSDVAFAAESVAVSKEDQRVEGAPQSLVGPKESNTTEEKVEQVRLSSFGIDETVKMVRAGVETGVIQTYIENSTIAYYPKAEEIIYLHDQGVPSAIITALITHGGKLRAETAKSAREQQEQIARETAAATATANSQASSYGFTTQPVTTSYAPASPGYTYVCTPPVYPSYTFSYVSPGYYSYGYPQCYSYRYYYPYGHYSYYPRYYRFSPYISAGFRHGFRPSFGFHGRARFK